MKRSSRSHGLVSSGLLMILAILGRTVARAADVTSCDEAGLRAAIAAGGTVTFQCDGTITLGSPIVITNDVRLDAGGRSVTVDGGGAVRLFHVATGVRVAMAGLTLANGKAISGGAIYSDAGIVALDRCTLVNHTALGTNGNGFGAKAGPAAGGAVYSAGGSITGSSCLFSNNHARGGKGGSAMFPGCGGDAQGGAIAGLASLLAFSDCQFIRNSAMGGAGGDNPVAFGGCGGAASGGAISLTGAELSLANTTFVTNSAVGGGPGIGANGNGGAGGTATGGAVATDNARYFSTNCNYSLNRADGGAGGRASQGGVGSGGALAVVGGSVTVIGGAIIGNAASGGFGRYEVGAGAQGRGGGFYNSSTAVVARACFGTNVAAGAFASSRPSAGPAGQGSGGALYNVGVMEIAESALVMNRASGGDATIKEGLGNGSTPGGNGVGGGICNTGVLRVLNTTIAGNGVTAGLGGQGSGGAIMNARAADLLNVTIANNAGEGGAVRNVDTFLIENSIVAYSNSGSNCLGSVTDGGGNISSDASCNFTAAGSLNNTDPRLGALGEHGGATLTMLPQAGSLAIDAANDEHCPLKDQRGVMRPQGAHCDIGAVEVERHEVRVTLRAEPGPADTVSIILSGWPKTEYRLLVSTAFGNWSELARNTTDSGGLATFTIARGKENYFYCAATP